MPYPAGHKLKVREQIITSAARAFRSNGVRNISLPFIMKGAGLTHGGFYAHFKNKDQLVIEAFHFAINDTIKLLESVADKKADQPRIQTIIEFYLSSVHRDQTEVGCILPALAGEISQLSLDVRKAYTDELKRFMEFIADTGNIDISMSYALVSSMIGTIALARAVNDSKFSDQLLLAGKIQAQGILETK
ncbi:TetR family transcriptional regulator [Bacillus safensis]|nr:TetR family transcriptional regulator [Bacillus safensis]